ncbi:MAG: alpha/beta hydrolase [Scytonematopsis contorta HA4267-MV1]|nr:alpha/beta hydrolase [Scytonematopsis contorta HA4267-MV1]
MGSGELPITNYQLPIPNSQFPITNYQFPIPNPQFPITNLHYLDLSGARE